MRFHLQKNVMIVLAEHSQIELRIRQFYDLITEQIEEESRRTERVPVNNDARIWQEAEFLAKQKPIVKLVNSFISEAVTMGASDIHLRPGETELRLAFRIDGELHPARSIEKHLHAALVSRIKILASMNIAEHRLPQDGRILLHINNQDVDLRVSIMPTPFGENVVIRILNGIKSLRSLEEIGYSGNDLLRIKEMIRKESGLILVTGPTGSGKSTTLYAMLQAIVREGINIVTIEDPIEFHQPQMVQIQLLASQGFGFPQTLRHVLRQDPDIIMIGEIRDAETALLAFEAALTGHLVLSTLHTTSACGVVPRLLELGISPQLLKSALLGVLAQRLVKHNCPHCLQAEVISELVQHKLGLKDASPYRVGKGCKQCDMHGYKGRLAVYELLEPDATLREHFSNTLTEYQLFKLASSAGMKSMLRYGNDLAKEGKVSLLEVYRACT
ncbi:GspE/PulE family protein [Chitinibacter bivalviorum]|nr:GspE/PulE family protein [Chitinibacter bivalviorum]